MRDSCLKHYSIRTEQPAPPCGRAKRAASTRNQALSVIVCLYKEVLGRKLEWLYNLERAKRPARVSVVLAEAEVRAVLAQMDGRHTLMAGILYGAGSGSSSACACGSRMSTSGIPTSGIPRSPSATARARKTGSRFCEPCYKQTSWPISSGVKAVHQKDLEEGFGDVYLPFALARKYPRAGPGVGGDSARPVLRPAGASVPFLSRRNGGNRSFQPPNVPSIRARV